MWYEDLTECYYFGEEYSKILISVGWLENGKEFLSGKIERNVYSKLCDFQKNPWSFGMVMGFYQCNLCNFQFESETEQGVKNIFIPHNGKIYVCPELITHYINNHFYLPPNEFIEAVLQCPPQNSMEYLKKLLEYLKKLLENGGRNLVRLKKNK